MPGGMAMAQKPEEQKKTDSSSEFLKSKEAQGVVNEYAKKGYTKRGVSELLRKMFVLYGSKDMALKEGKGLLASLKGEDGLGRVLGMLKLASEGLRKTIK